MADRWSGEIVLQRVDVRITFSVIFCKEGLGDDFHVRRKKGWRA